MNEMKSVMDRIDQSIANLQEIRAGLLALAASGETGAEPVVESAAWSVESAAESAAWSAAWSAAAWRKIAAKSIEIFAAAPVASAEPIAAEVERELCCRNLWCREGKAVSV